MLIHRKKATRGFTLIELVIVIAVIAILAALLVPTILGQAERARSSRARADAAQLAKSIARLRTDTGNTTTACLTVLANLTSATGASSGCVPQGQSTLQLCNTATPGYYCWGGPYVTRVVNDPWNLPYTATLDASTYSITVRSNGPNGTNADTDDVTYQQ